MNDSVTIDVSHANASAEAMARYTKTVRDAYTAYVLALQEIAGHGSGAL